MSVTTVSCLVVACDWCFTTDFDDDVDHVVHFETIEQAREALTQWRWDTDGTISCPGCAADADCAAHGHLMEAHPCYCKGRIPTHALTGCSTIHSCNRCGAVQETEVSR